MKQETKWVRPELTDIDCLHTPEGRVNESTARIHQHRSVIRIPHRLWCTRHLSTKDAGCHREDRVRLRVVVVWSLQWEVVAVAGGDDAVHALSV